MNLQDPFWISAAVVQNSTAERQTIRHLRAARRSAGKAQEAFMLLDPATPNTLIPEHVTS